MQLKDTYILKKEIDWSALHYGVNIPISLQVVFYKSMQSFMKKGDTKNIKLVIEGQEYPAKLTNIYFDERKYPGHKELLQIRYTPKSFTAKKLRQVFYESFNYLKIEKEKLINKKRQLKTPENIREFLTIYTTDFEDTFAIDCITTNEKEILKTTISEFTEEEFELNINYNKKDTNARIEKRQQLAKIRKLDKSICDNLKLLYNYKCQICGTDFGKNYSAEIVEAHHIQSFTTTLNNDFDNILIICPNHHRIIHKVNPIFNKKKLIFQYENGLTEKLILNQHL